MGGVAGHLSHLHENLDFTFGEIKSILQSVATANIDVVEKVDGQNLFWTFKDGALRTARNPTDIKKGGMSPTEYADKWKNHPVPAVRDAFTEGFKAIGRAVQRMSPEDIETIFDGGNNYINTEIMFVGNPNIIQYGANNIVLHNLQSFGGEEVTVQTRGIFQQLVDAVEDVEGELDKEGWKVSGPQVIQLKDLSEEEHYDNLVSSLDAFGMSDGDAIRDFVEERLRTGEVGDLPVPVNKQEDIIKLILGKEGAPSLREIKKGLPKDQQKTVSALATKTNSKKTISRAVAPIERVISDFAIEVLRGLESFFVVGSHDEEIARIKEQLTASIAKIENAQGDDAEAMGEMLAKQLEKLGDIENVASDLEGVVFEYPPGSEILYKLTGSFAMANQIIGRAARMQDQPAPPQENISDGKLNLSFDELEQLYESIANQGFKSVAIVGGAFKPPHLGHVSMVDHYANLADHVKVVISAPKSAKSQRFCGSICLTPDMSFSLWNILLAGRPNVSVEISSLPSPISVAYDSVTAGKHQFEPGTTVYLGASDKGGDANRYAGAVAKADPTLTVPDPIGFAAPAAELPDQYISDLRNSKYWGVLPSFKKKNADPKDYSASDLRELLVAAQRDPVAKNLAGYFVGSENVEAYMNAIGLLQESKKYSLKYWLYENI